MCYYEEGIIIIGAIAVSQPVTQVQLYSGRKQHGAVRIVRGNNWKSKAK